MSTQPRLAVNPIAYWLIDGTPDRSTANLGRAFAELADIGYRAVKADVPSDMNPADYLPWLEGFGLAPAVSLFNGSFDDPARHAEVAEAAGRFAAVQAGLGQSVCMISTIEPPGSPRMLRPAVGTDADEGRLSGVIDGMGAACRAMQAEGVTAALHPHVGGWVETEAEIRRVLDELGAGVISFGPDTGHMSWAGADVAQVLRDYADRIVAIHLKDTFAAGIARADADGLDYRQATLPGRIWAEPGAGDVDLQGCIDAFASGFTGDYMIEVDVPTVPLRECHQIAYDWAMSTLPRGASS
ncbi:inosose dehydratase [Nakamurella panacisegetis]|uniref:Inosose dehydratase n=1 Tax=Nakamurella panacisegetis TaxID=1090615 RepID=A0A1H0N667_9ACTN|nr:sugar phosphate isomerase/epimerase [Nakamurella panacisegetis]SDO87995.1 inosose dehydratase [Nakamurella panacisegetis]